MSFFYAFPEASNSCYKLDFKLRYQILDNDSTPVEHTLFSNGTIKFDTGADITIFHASQIGLTHITEEEFTRWMQTNEKVSSIKAGKINKRTLFGFSNKGVDDAADTIISYAYQVSDFDLIMDNGTVHLGSVPITVTFDSRFSQPLLGKDLLSLLNSRIDTDNNRLEVDIPKWRKEMSMPVDGIYMMRHRYYDVDNFIYGAEVNSESEMI